MALRYPRTLLDFEHRFRTEEACREYLGRVRWPEGVRCPRCGHSRAWRTKRGRLRCGACGVDIFVTAGTMFQDSKVSLRLWFRAIWMLTSQKSGISALGLQRALGLGSYRTAWTMLHKIRRAMVRPGRELLSGKIEVDETIVGGLRKFKKGQRPAIYLNKAIVVIAAEVRGKFTGRIRMRRVRVPSQENLIGFVTEVAAPGSEILTDGSWGYHGLLNLGFVHRPMVTQGAPKEIHAFIVPRVHRVAALLKRWVLGTYQGRISREQLPHYLDEFTFRFNRWASASRGQLFRRVLEQAVAVPPVGYRNLVKNGN